MFQIILGFGKFLLSIFKLILGMQKRVQKFLHLFSMHILVLERRSLYLYGSKSLSLLFPLLVIYLMISLLLSNLRLQASDLILQSFVCSLEASILLLLSLKLGMLQLKLSLGYRQLVNQLRDLIVSNLVNGVKIFLMLVRGLTQTDSCSVLLNETPVRSSHDLHLLIVAF